MTATERKTFLDNRRAYIGSSDAAAACGLGPWGTPYSVYCSKVYGIEKPSTSEMEVGTLMEPTIAMLYTHFEGKPLSRPKSMFLDPNYSWRAANCDFVEDIGCATEGIEEGITVETKNVSSYNADEFGNPGSDDIPAYYMMQTQHQIATRGHEECRLAALIGGNDFRVYTIHKSDTLIKAMTDAEAALYDMIQRLDPPEPDWKHPTTVELMKALCVPSPEAADVAGTAEHLAWMRQHTQMGKEEGDLKKARDAVKARLLDAMGQSKVMSLPDGTFIRRGLVEVKTSVHAGYSYYSFKNVKGLRG